MSSKRPPAPPPELKGFRYLSLLGSGGFSDVYLYEQDRPRRKVAVKVLLSDLRTETARRQFETEANLMAQLSSHPYIVTIYQAETTEGGHSYLAMEYCSRPSLDIRYRRERLRVDEVLAIGVQVASAVETAHRAGIAHRDIKPANILVTDYNRPALTDFGISGTVEGGGETDLGMSIPWSPPESFHGGAVDGVALDVWALGATLYTLLAGRSPFIMPGGDNSQRALVQRIHSSPVPPIGRADVPDSLGMVLSTAMSKSPGNRYSSAYTFALALQRIQSELSLSVTPFEVLEEPGEESDPDTAYSQTRVRGIVSISPHPQPPVSPPAVSLPAASLPAVSLPHETGMADTERTRSAGASHALPDASADEATSPAPGADEGEATILRGAPTVRPGRLALAAGPMPADGGDGAGGERVAGGARRRRALWASAAAAVVLIAAVGTGIALAPGLAARPAPNQTTRSVPPVDAADSGAVPNVTALAGTADASGVTFTWTNPQPRPGDSYMVTVLRVTGQEPPKAVTGTSITVPHEAAGQTCVRVVVRRSDGAAGAADESAPSTCVRAK